MVEPLLYVYLHVFQWRAGVEISGYGVDRLSPAHGHANKWRGDECVYAAFFFLVIDIHDNSVFPGVVTLAGMEMIPSVLSVVSCWLKTLGVLLSIFSLDISLNISGSA